MALAHKYRVLLQHTQGPFKFNFGENFFGGHLAGSIYIKWLHDLALEHRYRVFLQHNYGLFKFCQYYSFFAKRSAGSIYVKRLYDLTLERRYGVLTLHLKDYLKLVIAIILLLNVYLVTFVLNNDTIRP